MFTLLTSTILLFSPALLVEMFQCKVGRNESLIVEAYANDNQVEPSIVSTKALEVSKDGSSEDIVLARRIKKVERGLEDIRKLLTENPEAAVAMANMKKDIETIRFIISVTYPVIFGLLIAYTIAVIGLVRKKEISKYERELIEDLVRQKMKKNSRKKEGGNDSQQ
ncbi:hypothetical protein CEE45_17830 [Candidatus Heimdallarchaeota archaeon B3_Heim]|nr:MAG: hypothetical protein CEE45_17830 [Candidatus Heimdallarchaeota archaeon B3_Heim]